MKVEELHRTLESLEHYLVERDQQREIVPCKPKLVVILMVMNLKLERRVEERKCKKAKGRKYFISLKSSAIIVVNVGI